MAVHLRQRQQVGDDAAQAVDFVVDVLHELRAQLLRHIRLIEHVFQQQLHCRQGGFQFMRGVGDELTAAFVEVLNLLRHRIVAFRQLLEFAGCADVHTRGQVALAHAANCLRQRLDRAGEHPRQHQRRRHGRARDNQEHRHQLPFDRFQHGLQFIHRQRQHECAQRLSADLHHGRRDRHIRHTRFRIDAVNAERGFLPVQEDGDRLRDTEPLPAPCAEGIRLHLAVHIHRQQPPAEFTCLRGQEFGQAIHLRRRQKRRSRRSQLLQRAGGLTGALLI